MKPVGTNGIGEPRFLVHEIPPGSIVRFGIDDDMVAMVIANYSCLSTGYINGQRRQVQKLVFYGCLCESPDSWENERLFSHEHDLKDTLTVLLMPEYS